MKNIIAVLIIKDHGQYYLTDTFGETIQANNPTTVFNFLLKGYDDKNSFKIVWNLYQLFDLIGHVIPQSAFNTLADKDRVEINIDGHTYRLFSSAGRVFSITHKWSEITHANFQNRYEEEINIYHLAQYFPGEHYDLLKDIKYKGEELLKALDEMGYEPTKLSSPIAIYDEKYKDSYKPIMLDLDDAGIDFCDYAHNLLSREWRSCYKIGHFPQSFDHDVNGAYPSLIREFKDTNYCEFWYAKSLQKCDFGIVKGEINITSDYSPIVSSDGINRKGKYKDFFTTEQIGYLYYYKQGTFEIEDGHYLKFLNDDTPYQQMMDELYDKRDLGGAKRTFVKSVSVGVGGRFSQENERKFSDYYNPIYSTMMTSRMSLKVGKFIMNNNLPQNLISVVVDGCLTDKSVPIETSKRIGDWRVEEVKSLVMSLGYQFVGDKRPNNLTYNDMMKEILAHPNKRIYNNILINPNMLSNNRIFKTFPKTGRDLLNTIYESTAIEG